MKTPAPSALDDLPLYLPRLFYAFLGLIERRLADTGLDAHLRPGMGHVLLALYEKDDCIIKEIGSRVQITNGTLTGLLQRMEHAHLVECRKCAQDGRAVRVRLTPLGRTLEPRLREFHRSVTATVQQDLAPREVDVAHEIFERILTSMRADEPTSRETPALPRARKVPPRPASKAKRQRIRSKP
jgi:DNA-binding MarR family transcriptional regulator